MTDTANSIDAIVDQLKQVNDTIGQLQERADQLKKQLLELNPTGTPVTTATGAHATWRRTPDRLDTKAMRAAYPLDQHPECWEAKPVSLSRLKTMKGEEALEQAGLIIHTDGWTVSVK